MMIIIFTSLSRRRNVFTVYGSKLYYVTSKHPSERREAEAEEEEEEADDD
jgi:hypothetical protein